MNIKKIEDFKILCKEKSIVISTAESCTGGLLAAYITSAPGASNIYDRSFITYSNEAKIEMLNIPPETIKNHGAVSSETAEAMAKASFKNSNSNLAIATTGIAGPAGDTSTKKVGTVFISIFYNQKTHTEKYIFSGDRESVRQQTVNTAIKLATKIINS